MRSDARADRNLGRPAADVSTAPAALPQAATPLLSLRRAPAALAADATRQQYRVALNEVAILVDDSSCFAASLDGSPLVGAGADRVVVPASNLKLVTAAVALEVLGVDHVFTTEVRGDLAGDTVTGDLFLVGGGDATLATADYVDPNGPGRPDYPQEPHTSLEALADRIVAAGVRRVEGRIVGDESRYDLERSVPRWQDGIYLDEAGPLSALLVNDGFLDPADDLPGTDPAADAARLLAQLLQDRGVVVGGSGRGISPPGTAVIESIDSVPLGDLMVELLTTSDDNTAELLVKEIGLERSGSGTTAAGLAVVAETLVAWGVPTAGLELVDGSGLADSNRITCATLLAVLDRLGAAGPVFDGLPVAGRTGTLAGFFRDTALAGVLRAKTGNLSVARSLSGYVPGDHDVAFSLVVNGADNDRRAEETLWPRLALSLAAVPPAPSPADLAPPG